MANLKSVPRQICPLTISECMQYQNVYTVWHAKHLFYQEIN